MKIRSGRSDNSRVCPKKLSEGGADRECDPFHSRYLHFRLRPKSIASRRMSSADTESSHKIGHSSVNGRQTPRFPVKGLFTSINGNNAESRSPSRTPK